MSETDLPVGTILTDFSGVVGPSFYGHSAMILSKQSKFKYTVLDYAGEIIEHKWHIAPREDFDSSLCQSGYTDTTPDAYATVPNYERMAETVLRLRPTGGTDPLFVARMLEAAVYIMGLAAISVSRTRDVENCGSLWSYLQAGDPTSLLCAALPTRDFEALSKRFDVLRSRLLRRIQRLPPSQEDMDFPGCVFCSRVLIYVWQSALYWLMARGSPAPMAKDAARQLILKVLPIDARVCSPRATQFTLKFRKSLQHYWTTLPVKACAEKNGNLWADRLEHILSDGSGGLALRYLLKPMPRRKSRAKRPKFFREEE